MATTKFMVSVEEVGYRVTVLAIAKVASLGSLASLEAGQEKNLLHLYHSSLKAIIATEASY
jgi:hypothetical protein